MLDIRELNNLSRILNLHELCRKSELKYKTIYKRLERFRLNSKYEKISESDEIQLKKKG